MKLWKKNGSNKQRKWTAQTWLEWLLPLYVLLLPWQARLILAGFSADLPRYGDLSLYVTDILFFVLVVAWFFYLRAERHKPHGDWRRLRLPLLGVLAVFFYALASLSWTPDQIVGREQLFRLGQAILLGMMLASGAVDRTRLLIALALSGAIQGLFAIAQFFMQWIPASTILGMSAQAPQDLGVSVIEYADQRWLRAYGSLPHPNMLGVFCGLAMLASARLFWHGYHLITPKHMNRARAFVILGWSTFLLSLFGLLFSFSRSAWLAKAIGAGVFIAAKLFMHQEQRQKILVMAAKFSAASILILLFLSAVFGPLWWQRGLGSGALAKQSVTSRAVLQEQSRILSEGYRLSGSGIGSYFPLLVATYPNQPRYAYQPVHNVWRLFIVELGYKGLIWALFAMVALLAVFLKKRNPLGLAMMAFFVASTFFEHFWYSLPFGLLLAAVALALPLAKIEKS